MNNTGPLSRIRVVLSHPAHPGNIGAAARALKTMGLTRLYLVRPRQFPAPEARAMSSNALDVLEAAVVCETLDQALAGTAVQIAFTARTRVIAVPALDAREAAREAARAARTHEVALVFGREVAGLANEEVMRCNRLACIPAEPGYTSLNLAAAVQVAAYEVRLAALDESIPAPAADLADHQEVERFYDHLEFSLSRSGFLNPEAPRRLRERVRRLFAKVQMEKEEVSLLRGMLSAWDEGRSTEADMDLKRQKKERQKNS